MAREEPADGRIGCGVAGGKSADENDGNREALCEQGHAVAVDAGLTKVYESHQSGKVDTIWMKNG